MHRGWLGGCNRVRHKSRRPRLRVGNATPSRGEGVPHPRKRPSTTLLRHGKILVNGSFSHIPLSRRCHFQGVQYHFPRLRVSVGKVNVYKVEARRNRDLSVSRPWHNFVLLTVVDTRLLCPTNHAHPQAELTIARDSQAMRSNSCVNPFHNRHDRNRCEGCAGRKTNI